MNEPLAFKLRPTNIDEVVGQDHLVGENGFIRKLIESNKIFSLILFGSPGTGKTTIATILAKSLNLHYLTMNAVINNKKDIEGAIEEAKLYGHLVLILDEVHRLNKDKQDFLLPYIESGLITLIGATTANPYHSINPAIRSRCHLVEVKPLSNDDIKKLIKNAISSPKGLNNEYSISEEAIDIIARMSNGDVRYALNQLEISSMCTSDDKTITVDIINKNTSIPQYMIDNDEDGHYDAVSALQKSIRGSDVDGALYYLARLIAADDLDSIERRLPITAYEDIGLANPNAVSRTMEALRCARMVGFPEGAIPLGVAVVDLCLSPKSKSGCLAIENAIDFVKNNPLPVPPYLKFTQFILDPKERYPYDKPEIWPYIQYLPDEIKNIKFYKPNNNGSYERQLVENYKILSNIVRKNKISEISKK